jgi:hypothetical protein
VKIEIQKYTEQQGPVLEEGPIYEATLVDFREMDGKFGPQVIWAFEVEDPESGEIAEAAAFTSYSTADGDKVSNLTKFSKALNGGEMPLDENGKWDSDLLIGKTGRVVTTTYTRASGIVKNKVTNVLAPKGAKTAV